MRRLLEAGVVAVAAACLTGCHTYVPTELRAVPPGQEVRVYLSRQAIAALPEEILVNNLYVGGRLESQDADSVMLGIRVGQRDPGVISQDLRQRIKVGSGQIVDVQLREFSAGKTVVAVGGGALAIALIIGMIFEAENSTDIGDEDPDLSRVPVFSLPFRLPFFGP